MRTPIYPIDINDISVVAPAGGRALPAHLEFLRKRTHPTLPAAGVLAFGDARLDGCLPHGGLALGALHEMAAAGVGAETGVLPAAFVAGLLARLPSRRPVLWVARCADLYAPGLLHLDPGRLVLARADDDAGVLGAMEVALRAGGLAAVVGEVGVWGRIGARVASRRLQLACQARGVTAFAIRRWPFGGQAADREASAASTVWRLAPAPSVQDAAGPGASRPGLSRWVLELRHARGGRAGEWVVEVTHDGRGQGRGHDTTAPAMRVVAALADHPAAPATAAWQAAGDG